MQRGDNETTRTVVAVLVGAVVGFGVGAGVYLLLTPVLETADGLVRELQGFAWNLVPLGTVGGGVLGWIVVQRRRRHRGS